MQTDEYKVLFNQSKGILYRLEGESLTNWQLSEMEELWKIIREKLFESARSDFRNFSR